MKSLLWFSPVLPARTDIANYSARIGPFIAKQAPFVMVTPGGGECMPGVTCEPLESFTPQRLNRAGQCVYNVGNNPKFHLGILDVASRHPGIIILHDRALQDLFAGRFDHSNCSYEGSRYLEVMNRWYGRRGEEAAREVLSSAVSPAEIAGDFPLFEEAVQGAMGVVTHNPDMCDELANRFPGLPVLNLPLPYPLKQSTAQSIHSRKPTGPIHLLVFGFLNPNRRVVQILEAMASTPYSDMFQLDIAGEVNNFPEIESAVHELGLADRVTIHGFLPDDSLDALIARSHMVLNLRNPSMGEASGSQLRIWSNCAPSVVTDSGWYARIPMGTAVKVSAEAEASDLRDLLKGLAEGAVDLDAIAQAGRRQLAKHDPGDYAAALLEWMDAGQSAMIRYWAEDAAIEAVARGYANVLPPRFVPTMPARLLD